MGVINTVVGETEKIFVQYVENVFTIMQAPMTTTLQVAGVLSLFFVALNHIFQFRAINYSVYLQWGVRFVIIYCTATVWANFRIFYDLFVNLPLEYAVKLIPAALYDGGQLKTEMFNPARILDQITLYDGSKVLSPYAAMDEFMHAIFYVGNEILHAFKLLKGSTYKYIPAGILVLIIGVIFTGASIVILLVSKLGFAIAMGLAPLAISMLLFQQTRGYFESWLRLVGGFACVPLLMFSLMSIVITISTHMQREDDVFKGYMAFVLVALAALVLLFQIPTLASSLASATLPQMGPSMAAGAATRVMQVMKAPFGVVAGGASMAGSVLSTGKNMAGAAGKAIAGGASTAGAAFAAVKAARMNSQAGGRNAGGPNQSNRKRPSRPAFQNGTDAVRNQIVTNRNNGIT